MLCDSPAIQNLLNQVTLQLKKFQSFYQRIKMLLIKIIFVVALIEIAVVSATKYTGPTNAAGIGIIKEFESFRPNFQNDTSVGTRTLIGYGHSCQDLPCAVPIYRKYSVPLTRQSASALLKEDLHIRGNYEACVNHAVSYNQLTANQFSALVSFVYNMGCGNFRGSQLRNKINRGHIRSAANEFGKWVRGKGRKYPGLVRRRAAEKALFCRGIAIC